MKTQRTIGIAAVIVVLLGVGYFWQKEDGAHNVRGAIYSIDGKPLRLTDKGVQYFGNETKGDFDADGDEDSAFVFTHDAGGSGTFYYVVAALASNDGYQGTNAVLIGDRIAPQTTEFKDGMIVVNYADRKSGEPMTASPSVGISKYVAVENGILTALSIFEGQLVIGHEARTFTPCGQKEALWVMGKPEVYNELKTTYDQLVSSKPPYTAVFAGLIGKVTNAPTDGFGADYKNAFSVFKVINASVSGKCS